MALTIREKPMPQSKYDIKCPYTMVPRFIVIHNTAGYASAENEIAYMQSNDNQVSFHYAVDETEAILGSPLTRNCWHAGDGPSGEGNRYGISIEICRSMTGGELFAKAEENGAELTAKILLEKGWGLDRVKTHKEFSPWGKNCLPIDETELLTPDGWVNLGDIDVGDVVAQYNDGKIEFVEVQNTVEPYKAKVVKARRIEATLDHDIIFRDPPSQKWRKAKWEEVLAKDKAMFPVGGKYDGKGLDISDDYIRYLVWVQADGHYAQRKSKYTGLVHQLGIEFHFSKKRKVDRVLAVLENLGKKYSYHERKDGTYSIRIHNCREREEVEKYLDNKRFSWKLLEMSDDQREVFLDEIIKADGSIQNQAYFSTKQQNYDVVSAISAIHGKRCLQTTTGTSTALIFSDSNLCYCSQTADVSERETMVSCVTVPSGAILIRQYGQPKVVGNCPHRTLELGWDRFLIMVKHKMDLLNGVSPTSAGTPGDGNVPHDWARIAVEKAIKKGILKGSSPTNPNYRLNDPVTREEVLVFIDRALEGK